MTGPIPRAVLSEAVKERLDGRRVLAAVFCTFGFEPGFFELEVLPLLFDLKLHHVDTVRRLQLEDMLRDLVGLVAVYYDPRALQEGARGPASLDVRRIPVYRSGGYFHPKNVFLLVEDPHDGQRALLVVTTSANLTRAGWWENVEAVQIEELDENGRSRMREGLWDFLDHLRRMTGRFGQHGPLDEIRRFVRGLQPVAHRSSQGMLHPHFMANGRRGALTFVDFVGEVLHADFRGANLEIISPFLDDADESVPLIELVDLIQPRRWRVLLPEDHNGARCRETLFDSVARAGGQWGRLPPALTSAGDPKQQARRVHAKLYRLFTAAREVVFIGSANLTRAAHNAIGNVETGVLIETPAGARRRGFWLQPIEGRPLLFQPAAGEADETTGDDVVPLAVRYDWDTGQAHIVWIGRDPSPSLTAFAQGVPVFTAEGLAPETWVRLPDEQSKALASRLLSTSFLTVTAGDRRGVVLVQEDGMAYRPSQLLDLSPADILRFWSLLSEDQRAAYLAERGEPLGQVDQTEQPPTPASPAPQVESIFDRHAGVFHGFGSLLRAVNSALEAGEPQRARMLLFGAKYDSLPVLVERVAEVEGDPLDCYLMLLCAQQVTDYVSRKFPQFWAAETAGTARLRRALSGRARFREVLIARNDDEMRTFLDWYDRQFLRPVDGVPA